LLAVAGRRPFGRCAARPGPAPLRPRGLPGSPPARRAPDAHDARPPALRERLPLHSGVRCCPSRRTTRRGGRPAGLGTRRVARQLRTTLSRADLLTHTRGTLMEHQLELGYLVIEVPDPDILDSVFADVVGLVPGERAASGAHTWR